jgi:toxin-antitoxin system PIN domain toxin
VTLIDANLLVYAFATSTPEHDRAIIWLDGQFEAGQQPAFPWESLTAFVRLVTNPRIFERPASLSAAFDQVERWLGAPGAWAPTPTRSHQRVMGELIGTGEFTSKDTPDIHLAALAISHGLKLATHDAGFARFAGLRWFDPLG